jgi:S1/P1 Nuclease
MNRILGVVLTVCLLSVNGFAYGPRGHQLVGAIADRRLKENQAVANKVRDLLDGMTLERAATLPDEIKSRHCGDAPTGTRINRELQSFVNANCGDHTSHNNFHFTDVPVFGDEKYGDGEVGREDFDIVHMIPFCIRVLKGEEPETNEHAITKSIAVILLTHYLGDIHQPLHVGAEYFNSSRQPFEPTATDKGFADQGGNKLTLFVFVKRRLVSTGKFHSYWDGQAVDNAFKNSPNSAVAKRLAAQEPDNWQLTGEIETWAEQLANEIMPLAREAHDRLEFKNIVLKTGEHDITKGEAREKKPEPGGTFYNVWARGVVRDEIHKGGWRLAALLEQALQ